MKPGWRHAAWLALVWASACREADDVAQTVVWVEATAPARDAISRIEVQAEGPSDNLEPAASTNKPDWPIKLVLAPKQGDAGRRFTLHISAYDAQDNRLATIRFATGFVPKQTRYARVLIHEACVQAPATCADCKNYLLALAASELSREPREPREVDAACEGSDTVPPDKSDAGSAGSVNAGQGAAGVGPIAGSSGTAGSSGQPAGCGPGYLQTAGGCIDIDDCQNANPCAPHGQCKNLPGEYVCLCEPGFESRGGTCVSLDDCQTNQGGCESACQMSPAGAVVCSCEPQQWLKADRKSCGAFAAPVQLNRTGSTVPTQPSIAFGPGGNGLAVWRQSDGMSTALWTRRYVAGKGWAASAIKLPFDQAGTPNNPRVSLAANGRGTVVWVQIEESEGDIWSVRYDDPTFGEPIRIDEEGSGSAFDPSVQLDSAGNGFAAWTQTDGMTAEIWVNRVLADKGWQKPEAIKTSGNEQAFAARLAIDDHGNAELVWTQTTFSGWTQDNSGGWTQWMNGQGARWAPWSSRFDPKMERWHAPAKLDDTGSAGFPDAQLFGAEGNRIAVWPRMVSSVVSVLSAFSTKGMWSDPADIAARGSEFTMVFPRLALAPSGNGAAIWTEFKDSTGSIWANPHQGASAEWVGPSELSSFETASGPPLPQIAVDPSGDGIAVWSEIHGTSATVKAARLQTDLGFIGNATLAMTVTGTETQSSPAQVAVDAQGNAVAIWEGLERGLYFVSASAFE